MWVILVPVANRPECAVALDVSFSLAKRMKGTVIGAHIRTHRGDETALDASEIEDSLPDWATDDASAGKAMVDAADLFAIKAKNAGYEVDKDRNPTKPEAFWQERVGTPEFVIPIIGPASDMVVVSRPETKKSKKARAFMLQAIMHSHRPVLVLPRSGPAPDLANIAIGWNRSPEAARAVHANLPILQAADSVTFVTAGSDKALGPSVHEMEHYLALHGVKAKHLHQSGADSKESLLKGFEKTGADTLMIGAYSESRWLQRLFGGTSEYLLKDSDIPLLMMHS